MNHTTLSPRQRRAVRDFLADCPLMEVRATWACAAPGELPGHVRQIRKVTGVLAEAETGLNHVLVLTPDLRLLQLTREERFTL